MWKTVKLGDLCETITKGTTPTSVGFKFTSEGINFVKVESLAADGTFITSKFAKINSECHEALKRSQLKEGDILFSIAGALGRTAIVTKDVLPANTNQALAIVRLKESIEVDKRFLLYVLNSESTKEQSDLNKSGVAQQNLSLTQLKNYGISLPPLAEQQRIVAKLDAAFAEIDKANQLNDKRTKEVKNLIAKSQNQLFLSISETATVMRLGDIAKFENGDRGKNYPSKKYQIDEGIPFVNAGDFSLDGDIETQRMVYISEERFNLLGAGKFKIDDVLFCLRGSLGKSAINKSIEIGAIASSLVILRAKQSIVSSDYLFAYVRSDIVKNLIAQTAGGAAQPNLSAKVVSNYAIPVPPLKEQQRLTEKFWLIREKGLVALDRILQKSQHLIELKAAILAKELQRKESEAA